MTIVLNSLCSWSPEMSSNPQGARSMLGSGFTPNFCFSTHPQPLSPTSHPVPLAMTSQPPLCNISRTTMKGRGALTSCVLIDLEAPLLLFVLNILFSGDETKAERLPVTAFPGKQRGSRQWLTPSPCTDPHIKAFLQDRTRASH